MHLNAVVPNLHVPIAAAVVNSRRRKKTIDNCIIPLTVCTHAATHSLTTHTPLLVTNCLIYCRRKINEYAAADGSRQKCLRFHVGTNGIGRRFVARNKWLIVLAHTRMRWPLLIRFFCSKLSANECINSAPTEWSMTIGCKEYSMIGLSTGRCKMRWWIKCRIWYTTHDKYDLISFAVSFSRRRCECVYASVCYSQFFIRSRKLSGIQ